jgi:hypothetical protein
VSFDKIGENLLLRIGINECLNLPENWQNRASSILTSKCVVLFTSLNCKFEKSAQLFTKNHEKNFNIIFSLPDKIPNKDFFRSV